MAALVHSFPPQSSSTTTTMLQARPSSASGILQNPQNQPLMQYPSSNSQPNRNSYHGLSNSTGSYRGQTTTAPIAPYAFTSTPAQGQKPQGPHLRADQRTSSAPIVPTTYQHEEGGQAVPRTRYPAAASISTTSTSSSDASTASQASGTKDDFALVSSTARIAHRAPRPHSTIITSSVGLAPPSTATPTKASPDRYRRPANRRADSATSTQQQSQTPPSVSTMPNVQNFYGSSMRQQVQGVGSPETGSQLLPNKGLSADDMQLSRQVSDQAAKRYRRRSIHTIEAHEYTHYNANSPNAGMPSLGSRQTHSSPGGSRSDQQLRYPIDPLRSSPINSVRPTTSHGRHSSSESVNSTRSSSRPSSAAKREASASMATVVNPAPSSSNSATIADSTPPKHDQPRLVNIPARASSADAARRIANPSPLSKPVTMTSESQTSKDTFASTVSAALQVPSKPISAQLAPSGNSGSSSGSLAAQQLAALSEKDGKKSKSSRLRRALSFGSAAELRKASVANATHNATFAAERAKLRKDQFEDAAEAEQARIAARQEAGGIGSGIYSGQGNFFSGSNDNLSISSTASSASVMIRKMGKGMKKSTRSLVGLFRPKSVIGVPAADAAVPIGSQAQVSMVTVEAEREKMNINVDPHDHHGGGTGYPRLELNSVDAAVSGERLGSSSDDNSPTRRSIVGGEKERAEVLAAVKKGILKRTATDTASGSSSPVVRPADSKSPNFNLPQIPTVNDSPISSTPSTPNDDPQGHRRTGSVTLGGEDYFMSALRFRSDSKSVPTTPQGNGLLKRNATFSPRIQFHDTWPSGEYDRRGEISTCNRLTPMLAQQIKEELNTFKMEMEVHETSKIYTHFF